MIDCEIVTVAPKNADYPAFRKRLQQLAPHFKRLHYVFSYHSGIDYDPDYYDFLKNNLTFCNLLDADLAKSASGHWYQDALTTAFKQCVSEYILVLEPDFIIDPDELINALKTFNRDVLTYADRPTQHHENTKAYPRMSPAFFLMRRSLMQKTKMDFSEGWIDPSYSIEFLEDGTNQILHYPKGPMLVDCFNKFTSELFSMNPDVCLLQDLGITNYHHYAGITHNFTLCRDKNFKVVHRQEEFVKYLKNNLDIQGINYDPRYIAESLEHIAALS